MNRIQRPERSWEGIAGAGQDRWPEQHEVDGFDPLSDDVETAGRLVRRKLTSAQQAVDGAPRFDLEQLARNQPFGASQLGEGAGLVEGKSEQRGGVEVERQRRSRSARSAARLSVRVVRRGGFGTSRGRLDASRRSSPAASIGTMWATGVSRSSTTSVRPFLTERRCALNRALSSAILTAFMVILWS